VSRTTTRKESRIMSVVRWYPSRDVGAFQDSVNRLFDSFFRSQQGSENELTSSSWAPAVDIYETENEVVLKAELPEVDPKAIEIHAENNVLTVKGERNLSDEVREENYHRIERTYGSFSRSFTLPGTVDPTKINAKYKDGVLKLTIPKKEESKPRQVNIEVEAG
jgi:HSP20 family protein